MKIRQIENWVIAGAMVLLAAMLIVISLTIGAFAQGIYCCGPDGRVHSTGIVSPDGRVFPVIPTYCENGWGPCPLVLAPPLPWRYVPPPPLAYAPPLPAPFGYWGR